MFVFFFREQKISVHAVCNSARYNHLYQYWAHVRLKWPLQIDHMSKSWNAIIQKRAERRKSITVGIEGKRFTFIYICKRSILIKRQRNETTAGNYLISNFINKITSFPCYAEERKEENINFCYFFRLWKRICIQPTPNVKGREEKNPLTVLGRRVRCGTRAVFHLIWTCVFETPIMYLLQEISYVMMLVDATEKIGRLFSTTT